MEQFTQEQIDEYKKNNGWACPLCKSRNIQDLAILEYEEGTGRGITICQCRNCTAKWKEFSVIDTIERIK